MDINNTPIMEIVGESPDDYLDLVPPQTIQVGAGISVTQCDSSEWTIMANSCGGEAGISSASIQASVRSVLDEMTATNIEAVQADIESINASHVSVDDMLDVSGDIFAHRNLSVTGDITVSGLTNFMGHTMLSNASVTTLDVSSHTRLQTADVCNLTIAQYGGEITYYANGYEQRSLIQDLTDARTQIISSECQIADLNNELAWAKRELQNLLTNMHMMNSKMNSLERTTQH